MATPAQSVTEALHAEIDPVESFRQGWKEVQEGKTRPIEGLWERVGLD